jgi:AcrR family transcriptional regulator
MTPRRPAVLRDSGDERTIEEHLVATAARLLDERGSAGLTVRDIAGEARVAVGALYNHFADKEELLARALARHVVTVMTSGLPLPVAGTATVAKNLRAYVEYGLAALARVLPAFVGFLDRPAVMRRTMDLLATGPSAPTIPHLVGGYLTTEQSLGRIRADADLQAATTLIVGACHEAVLPRLLFDPTSKPTGLPRKTVDGLVTTVLAGIGA